MQILSKINQRLPRFTPSEALVARYVLAHPETVPDLSLQRLAAKCSTSDATIMRFCWSLKFNGYQHFKSALTAQLIERGQPRAGEQSEAERYAELVARDVQASLSGLRTEDLSVIAERIVWSRHTIVVGVGGSGSVAEIFASALVSINIAAVQASDRVAIERWSNLAAGGDVLLGIAHGGLAPEVIAAVKRARENDACTVALTNTDLSELAGSAHYVLLTAATERLLGIYACHPRIAQLAVLEVLLEHVTTRAQEAAPQEAERREPA